MQNQQNDRFQEVGSNGSNNQRWEPNKLQLIQGQPLPWMEGYFKDVREISGQKGPFTVTVISTVNPDGSLGQDIDVSGGKALDDKLNEIPLGTYVRIEYQGKVKSRIGGNEYKNWKVWKDVNAVPYGNLGGHVKQQTSQQTNPVQQNNNQGQQQFNGNGNGQQQFHNGNQNTGGQPQFNPNQGFGQNNGQGQPQFNPNGGQGQPQNNGGGAPVFNASGQAGQNAAPQFNSAPNFQAPGQTAAPAQNNGQSWSPQQGQQNFQNQQGGQGQPQFNPNGDGAPAQDNSQNFAQNNGGAAVFGGPQGNGGLPF